MSQALTSIRSHSCESCRRKRIPCDREKPSCGTCIRKSIECIYIPSNSRYTVSREKSCIHCQRRRMRCDRGRPCDRCVNSELECMYKPPHQAPIQYNSTAPSSLTSQKGDDDSLAGPSQEGVGPSSSRSQYVSTLLSITPSAESSGHLHPPVAQIWSMYQIFSDNVDPLLKLTHLPSFHHQVLSAIEDVLAMDSGTETLLFAIYFSALVSISNTECMQKFKMERIEALSRYVHQFTNTEQPIRSEGCPYYQVLPGILCCDIWT